MIEGANLISGRLTSDDVDASSNPLYAVVGDEVPGLVINTDGSWTFDPADGAYDSLKANQTQTIEVSYLVTDDQGYCKALLV